MVNIYKHLYQAKYCGVVKSAYVPTMTSSLNWTFSYLFGSYSNTSSSDRLNLHSSIQSIIDITALIIRH